MGFEVSSIEGIIPQRKKYFYDRLIESGAPLPRDWETQDFETLYYKLLNFGVINPPISKAQALSIARTERNILHKRQSWDSFRTTEEVNPIYPDEPVYVSPTRNTSWYLSGDNTNASSLLNAIPYDPAKRYRWSFQAKAADANSKIFYQATWRARPDVQIGNSPYIQSSLTLPTTWTTFVSYTGPTAPDLVPPAGVQLVAPMLYINHVSSEVATKQYFSNFELIEL